MFAATPKCSLQLCKDLKCQEAKHMNDYTSHIFGRFACNCMYHQNIRIESNITTGFDGLLMSESESEFDTNTRDENISGVHTYYNNV